jgi:hypothetical protein
MCYKLYNSSYIASTFENVLPMLHFENELLRISWLCLLYGSLLTVSFDTLWVSFENDWLCLFLAHRLAP